MSKHVLFLCHDASRTGAPFLLLHLLRWLKQNSDLTWEVVFRDGGELLPEFEELSPVTVWRQPPTRLQNWVNKVRRRIGGLPDEWQNRRSRDLSQQLVQKGADLIYSNTTSNGPMLQALSSLKCPVICHAHELEFTISVYIGKEKFDLSHALTDHYIAASQAVKDNLVLNHATSAEIIDVVHEFVPASHLNSAQILQARESIRRKLQISASAPIVISAGLVVWRKGSDLWVQMAALVARQLPAAHFLWVGDYTEESLRALQHDVTHLGITERVHFLGTRSNMLDYFAAADVFTMTSREDPFPLVNLEAASVGKPIVCFEGAGGTPELVEDDCGFIVPYLDVNAMADRVVELLNSPETSQQMGARAAQKVREHYEVTCSAPKVLDVIQRCLSNES